VLDGPIPTQSRNGFGAARQATGGASSLPTAVEAVTVLTKTSDVPCRSSFQARERSPLDDAAKDGSHWKTGEPPAIGQGVEKVCPPSTDCA
jgi:hypothetical protein